MGHSTCCVIKCRNNGKNSSCKFYSFPTSSWKLVQRNKWIAAVKRKNADGSPWHPKPQDKICSEHFIGGKKSDAEASPNYVPTIFPSIHRCKKIDHSQVAARYNRSMKRRYVDQPLITTNYEHLFTNVVTIIEVNEREFTMMAHKECQADIYSKFELKETTFICNRFVQNNTCDAEIQVDISTTPRIVTRYHQNTKEKGCCTDEVTYSNKSTSTSTQDIGISSVKLCKIKMTNKKIIDPSGKEIKVVRLPFLKKKNAFTIEENQQT